MTNDINSLLSIVNFIITQHPLLASQIESLAQKAQGQSEFLSFTEWATRQYESPAPVLIKNCCMLRNNLPNAIWVETGTFYGDTTDFLSKNSKFVYSIEPQPNLYEKALIRFINYQNVKIINDISENALPSLLPNLSGNVCFWLDGHYSAGETFAGPNDTPLLSELQAISENLHLYNKISILIDDIRLCGKKHAYGDYPSLNLLVNFATSNNLDWYIEHDIFIAKSF